MALGGPPDGLSVDLGSGAGLPGLPLALAWPNSRWVLLEAGSRRIELLEEAIRRLGLEERVRTEHGRAEEAARRPGVRGTAVLVVARGFGPPATTAECAAPLLAMGGTVLVSEPPPPPEAGTAGAGHEDQLRWPAVALAGLGLVTGPQVEVVEAGATYQQLHLRSPCPERYPRRNGVPRKRPLW